MELLSVDVQIVMSASLKRSSMRHRKCTTTFIMRSITQPLIEMSTRCIKIIMFLGSKVRRVRKADNLTAICEPIV
jgi:hypothetical protein